MNLSEHLSIDDLWQRKVLNLMHRTACYNTLKKLELDTDDCAEKLEDLKIWQDALAFDSDIDYNDEWKIERISSKIKQSITLIYDRPDKQFISPENSKYNKKEMIFLLKSEEMHYTFKMTKMDLSWEVYRIFRVRQIGIFFIVRKKIWLLISCFKIRMIIICFMTWRLRDLISNRKFSWCFGWFFGLSPII